MEKNFTAQGDVLAASHHWLIRAAVTTQSTETVNENSRYNFTKKFYNALRNIPKRLSTFENNVEPA